MYHLLVSHIGEAALKTRRETAANRKVPKQWILIDD